MHENGRLPRARQDGPLRSRESHRSLFEPGRSLRLAALRGEHDLAELAVLAGASEDLVAGALYELREKNLLDAEPDVKQSTVPGESRREAIVRVGRYGAAAAAGSMIVSATAATPALASSTPPCWQCRNGTTGVFCTTTEVDCCASKECAQECSKFCTNKGFQEGTCESGTCSNKSCTV
jgi:hypothetical protein